MEIEWSHTIRPISVTSLTRGSIIDPQKGERAGRKLQLAQKRPFTFPKNRLAISARPAKTSSLGSLWIFMNGLITEVLDQVQCIVSATGLRGPAMATGLYPLFPKTGQTTFQLGFRLTPDTVLRQVDRTIIPKHGSGPCTQRDTLRVRRFCVWVCDFRIHRKIFL
jgi:hypothetical protein